MTSSRLGHISSDWVSRRTPVFIILRNCSDAFNPIGVPIRIRVHRHLWKQLIISCHNYPVVSMSTISFSCCCRDLGQECAADEKYLSTIVAMILNVCMGRAVPREMSQMPMTERR